MTEEGNGARHDRDWGAIVFAIIAVASLIFAYTQWNARRRLEVAVDNQYFRAFFDFLGNVDNVRVSLSKSLAAGSPRTRVGALSDVWKEASSAQANLNSLPVTQGVLARTSTFLTQVGDFAYVTARKMANQEMMTDEDWQRLVKMKEQSEDLAKGLADMESEAAAGRVNWMRVANQAKSEVKKGQAQTGNAVSDGLTKVDEQVQHFPTLIYDGPFSDHIEKRQPVGITGSPITEERAKEIARSFVPFDASAHTASLEDEIKSKIPAFRIKLTAPKKSGKPDAVVDVSKVGGHVILMNVARDLAPKTIDLKAAINKASDFLIKVGKSSMAPTFASEVGDVAVIPFVYEQDKVRVYPDLIKVKVALDTGDIISYDALGYLTSHQIRKLPKPALSQAEARSLLSPAVRVTETPDNPRLAVIPVETVSVPEAFCWEFMGTSAGDDVYVYINAENGTEEKILQLVKTSEGSLTM